MVNQKQLSIKLKPTPKMILRTRKMSEQKKLNTPTTPVVIDEQDGLAETIIKIVKEEFKADEKIVSEIISSNLKTTNECLEKISTEVLELKKSLEFMQNKLDEKNR